MSIIYFLICWLIPGILLVIKDIIRYKECEDIITIKDIFVWLFVLLLGPVFLIIITSEYFDELKLFDIKIFSFKKDKK